MAILPILTAPDPRLKVRCKPVEKVDASIRRLMDDMLETMYAAPGIGLAAPQVGVDKQIIVIDVAKEGEPRQPYRMANPQIVWTSEETVSCEEGCLSVPDQWAEVVRPAEIKVRYLDHENEIREMHCTGMLATCVQHEMDHLNGTLFIDHLSTLKRDMILRKLTKLRRQKTAVG